MNLIFLDTETTGNDVAKDRLCQVCIMQDGVYRTEFFKPPLPISVKSMSITHITNKMVEDKPDFEGSQFKSDLEKILKDGIVVAHNAKFDIAILEAEGLVVPKHICTLRVARHLDAENKIPEYNLQYLRYFLELDVAGSAHDAEGDVRVLHALFERLLKKMEALHNSSEEAIAEMCAISERPSLFSIIPFGKYKDKKISDVAKSDRGYLEWLLKQKLSDGEGDEDWIYTLKTYLK
ncbi:MAG: exonuclease domain-containing protein [Minisyncoccia bacterium]